MIASLFEALFRLTLASSAAILGVLALRRLLRHHFGAGVALAAWLAVPCASLAVLLPAPTVEVVATPSAVATAVLAPVAPALPLAPAFDPRPLLLGLWIVGALLALAWLLRGQWQYLRRLGRLAPLAGGTFWRAEKSFAGPAVIGLWRPRIILPADFVRRHDARERALILAHEADHCRRGDPQANALVAALRVLQWFNPLVHWAAARFRLDQELACDAAVLACFPGARRAYADALLRVQLAGQRGSEPHLRLGNAWRSHPSLKERILMLKASPPTRHFRRVGGALVAVLALGAALASWASQPARAPAQRGHESSPHEAGFVDASLRIDLDGTRSQPLRVIHPLDRPFELADGAWRGEFVASAASPDRIDLRATIRKDGRLIATPEVQARPGESFAIAVDGREGGSFRMEGSMALAATAPPAALPPPAPVAPPAAPVAPPPPPAVPAPPAPPAAAPAMTAPGYRSLSAPTYPQQAIRDHIEGTVFLRVQVDAEGRPEDVRVERADPESAAKLLAPAAIAAVRGWTFEPAREHGHAIRASTYVPIHFALGDASRPSAGMPGALEAITVRGDL